MEKKNTGLFFNERTLWHRTGVHAGSLPVGEWVQPPSSSFQAESPESKRRLKNLLDVSGLTDQLLVRTAPMVNREDLQRVHPESYLNEFKALSDTCGGNFGSVASFGPGSYEIACLSAGLASAAVEAVLLGKLNNAYALSRPPGHHCLPNQAMGFCFLANIPIAIERAKKTLGLGKVAIIDWDVHHGNGTQHIYWHRDDVLTISLHQENCYPPGYSGARERGAEKGKGYNINIPLYAGAGHQSWLYAIDTIVAPALTSYEPEMIIIACGLDGNALDPLGRMQLHSDSFRVMTDRLKLLADKLCQGKLVMVHEGGYSDAYVPFCGLATLESLSGIRTEVSDPVLEFIRKQQPGADFIEFQRQSLDQLARDLHLN